MVYGGIKGRKEGGSEREEGKEGKMRIFWTPEEGICGLLMQLHIKLCLR